MNKWNIFVYIVLQEWLIIQNDIFSKSTFCFWIRALIACKKACKNRLHILNEILYNLNILDTPSVCNMNRVWNNINHKMDLCFQLPSLCILYIHYIDSLINSTKLNYDKWLKYIYYSIGQYCLAIQLDFELSFHRALSLLNNYIEKINKKHCCIVL